MFSHMSYVPMVQPKYIQTLENIPTSTQKNKDFLFFFQYVLYAYTYFVIRKKELVEKKRSMNKNTFIFGFDYAATHGRDYCTELLDMRSQMRKFVHILKTPNKNTLRAYNDFVDTSMQLLVDNISLPIHSHPDSINTIIQKYSKPKDAPSHRINYENYALAMASSSV